MRKPLAEDQDAFGHALMDHLQGKGGVELIERDDGFIDVSAGAETYFAAPQGLQCTVADNARGRVLDVGCGAGRYALYLQQQGRDVVGIDASPLAVQVCHERGVRDARLLALNQVSLDLGTFDSIVMLGANFGLFGNMTDAKRLLRRFARIVDTSGCIVAQTLDPYNTNDEDHLAYHIRNRERGRMGGQIRMRVRYRKFKTPWFDYLFVSLPELEQIIEDTGWQLGDVFSDDSPSYSVVLNRTAHSSKGPASG